MSTVTGSIDSNPIDGWVVSLRRSAHICSPGANAVLTLSPDYPYPVEPSDDVALFEQGTQVLAGYCVRVRRERPSYNFICEADDAFTRATNYFIDYPLVVGYDPPDYKKRTAGYTEQTTTAWIEWLCDLCGLGHEIDTASEHLVPVGTNLGLRTVAEALNDVMAYASLYVRVRGNGNANFNIIHRNVPNFTLTRLLDLDDTTKDDEVRTVIKTYGGWSGSLTNPNAKILSVASTTVAGIVPDRIAVVASPMISTQSEADRVSAYMLSELSTATRVVSATIPGNPKVTVGKVARITSGSTDYTDCISSLESTWNEQGYRMNVVIGERCPRIAGYSKPATILYAALNGNGVYRSFDQGNTWTAFNDGLPAGSKVASRIAGNAYGQGLALVNNSLYYAAGDTWASTSISSAYGTIKGIGALGGQDNFAVLTSGSGGSYVHFSSVPLGSGWTAEHMSTTTSGSTNYGITGIDLYGKTGSAMVIANTSSGSGGGSFPTTTILDDFNRANQGPPPSASWSNISTYDGLRVSSNQCAISIYGSGMGYWINPFGPDSEAYATLAASSVSTPVHGNTIHISVRGVPGDSMQYLSTGYTLSINMVNTSGTISVTAYILRWDAGSFSTYLATYAGLTGWAVGDSFGISAIGSTITAYHKPIAGTWTEIGHVTDTHYSSAGNLVLYGNEAGGTLRFDDFGGGDAVSGTFDLYAVSLGGTSLVSTIPTSGSPSSRLFVAEDGEAIVYNTAGKLYTNGSGTFSNVFPSSASGTIKGVTRAQLTSGSGNYDTVIGNTSGSYQGGVETAGGWHATGALPANFNVTDMVWSSTDTQGVIVGSNGSNNTKIVRMVADEPFTTITTSDSGIPQEAASGVLDLETGE